MSIENGSNENYDGIIKINNTHRIYIPQELIPYLYTASVSNESCWDQLINIINNKKVQKNTDIVLCGMPDIHIGYAFPIGTIVGMPLNKHTLISPMGVGNDINCGVRCLKTNLKYNDIKDVKIVRMEVPCCGGIVKAVEKALKYCGKMIPWQVVTISTDGNIIE